MSTVCMLLLGQSSLAAALRMPDAFAACHVFVRAPPPRMVAEVSALQQDLDR